MAVYRYRIAEHTRATLIKAMAQKLQEAPGKPVRLEVKAEVINHGLSAIGGESTQRDFELSVISFTPGDDAWMAIQVIGSNESGTITFENDDAIVEVS